MVLTRRIPAITNAGPLAILSDDRRARRLGLALLLVSLVMIAVSSVAMAYRLADHNEADTPVPFALVVAEREAFTFGGIDFSLSTLPGPPAQVVVSWGDESVRLLVAGRDVDALPGLARHADWLAVMRIAEGVTQLEGLDESVRSGEIPSRLLVVARAVPPGMDPESWGAAKFKDNIYTYLELNPDGTITRSERTYREIAGDVRSWRHVAAMKVTGGLNSPSSRSVSPISYPNYAGVREAMASMGWTWPAFGLGALGSLLGLVLLLGSYVERPPASP